MGQKFYTCLDKVLNKFSIRLVKAYMLYLNRFKSGFPKVGQVAPLGAMTDTQGATISIGATGGHEQ